SFLFANLSMGCEILKIIKQPPNGSKTVHYLRLASRMRGLLGSARTAVKFNSRLAVGRNQLLGLTQQLIAPPPDLMSTNPFPISTHVSILAESLGCRCNLSVRCVVFIAGAMEHSEF
ncbi:MAG: hypothetical protein WAT12_12850, partial [Candidatus Nitrotoga sp.]